MAIPVRYQNGHYAQGALHQDSFNGFIKSVMERRSMVIALVAAAVVLGLVLWYFIFGAPSAINQQAATPNGRASATAQPAATSSLGGQIYQQSQNPLQKKLPETNPIKNANPLQGAYKNPF